MKMAMSYLPAKLRKYIEGNKCLKEYMIVSIWDYVNKHISVYTLQNCCLY